MRTNQFKKLFAQLPRHIQELAQGAFDHFRTDPHHPMLHNHPLADSNKGRHRNGSRAVWITRRYRAIYVQDGDTNVWYWIGSHEDYNNFIGSRRK